MFAPRRAVKKVQYPFVFDAAAESKQASAFVGGMKIMLPADVERTNNKVCEEVLVPAAQPRPRMSGEASVRISELNPIGQMAFKGYTMLNRIQSVVFDTAYTTSENMLVCAPTGAGKTNVAMLSILQCVESHVEMGVIQKDQFKIIYVAPMKALAAEMTAGFGKRLAPLGLSVKELTGDMQLTKAEIMKTNMLITTPEKWDVVTRKSTGDVALTQVHERYAKTYPLL